jgi:hypothetical protein
MSNVSYSAVVIDEASRKLLLNKIAPIHKEVIAHHMTINLGPLKGSNVLLIGQEVELRVVTTASDDKVQAVGVKILNSKLGCANTVPHITLSVNRQTGGKPMLSNKLTNWTKIAPFTVKGIVTEVSS